MAEVIPFRIDVPEAELADLRVRLRQTRWPEREPVADWSQGVPLAYLRELCGYWADGYDWRATEARLNALPQFQTVIDGLPVHFIHAPLAAPGGAAADHHARLARFGRRVLEGDRSAVRLVAYGQRMPTPFTSCARRCLVTGSAANRTGPGWGIERIAGAWASLMARLGYRRYGAVGSDWGTSVSTLVGQAGPEHVAGIHLIPPLAGPDPDYL